MPGCFLVKDVSWRSLRGYGLQEINHRLLADADDALQRMREIEDKHDDHGDQQGRQKLRRHRQISSQVQGSDENAIGTLLP